MRPFEKYPILDTLFQPFRWTQRLTLGLVVAAILESSAARSMEIATLLASWLDIRLDSALNRFYRLLRNVRIFDHLLSLQLLRLLKERLGKTLLVAIDWTSWHPPLHMLVASVICDRRAIPVYTAAFDRDKVPRSQNARENTFVKLLASLAHELAIRMVVLCDRGFRRASWLGVLMAEQLDFVVRLMSDVHVHDRPGRKSRPLRRVGLEPGGVLDLGWVPLRCDGVVTVRVIGIWEPGAREPWWLATNLNDPVSTIAAYYDRRIACEQQFRDTKGCRFGLRLFWTQFQKPDHLARFALLAGIAIFVWTSVGVAVAQAKPSFRLPHAQKGPRQSYVLIGHRAVRLQLHHLTMAANVVLHYLPQPILRTFPWIDRQLQTTTARSPK